jgi:hypothetical protein
MAGSERSRAGWFGLVTAPARWLGRLRPDLAASIEADAITFAGARSVLFLVLALIAVAFPLVASIVRAVQDGASATDTEFLMTLNPSFYYGYTESIPFMALALAIGVLSPSLGVLWVLVHAPADLISTALVHAPASQLDPPEAAIAARVLSDAVLWIGAVELPLLARRWAATWPARLVNRPSAVRAGSVMAAAMAVLAYLWVNTAFWLVIPVFNWTSQGGPGAVMPLGMVEATLVWGWIVAVAAACVAFVTGLIMPAEALAAGADFERGGSQGVRRELLGVVVPALLLSGLMLKPSEAASPSNEALLIVLILGGLIVAGPVLTRVLPRIPAGPLDGMPPVIRWGIALVVAFGGTWLVTLFVPNDGSTPDYVLLATLFAIVAPVVRIIVDAGTPAPTPAMAAAAAGPLGSLLALVFVMGLWLALPAVVLGHDESPGMPQGYPLGAGALLGGAGLGAAMSSKRQGQKAPPIPRPNPVPPQNRKPPPPPPPRPDGPLGPNKKTPPPDQGPKFLDDPKGWFNNLFS